MIGHRGASGYRPEHTLAAYELAARMGADRIEPDLVSTRDGVLVARHENELARTTDVAEHPEFVHRFTTKRVDGAPATGWFTEDFTLAELKTLRARERFPDLRQRNVLFTGRFAVPTLDDILRLRARLSHELGREIGVCAELKHSRHFAALGRPAEDALAATLRRHHLDRPDSPVLAQCFDPASLRRLRADLGVRVPLVLLAEDTTRLDPAALAGQVDGIGPHKHLVIPRRPDGSLGAPTGLVDAAHAAGLFVHAFTFRAENRFLPADLRIGTDPTAYGDAIAEQVAYLRAGVDGLITDQPDLGVLARELATEAEAA